MQMVFGTIFDKMYLSLSNIKVEKFKVAEINAELTRGLFDYKEA